MGLHRSLALLSCSLVPLIIARCSWWMVTGESSTSDSYILTVWRYSNASFRGVHLWRYGDWCSLVSRQHPCTCYSCLIGYFSFTSKPYLPPIYNLVLTCILYIQSVTQHPRRERERERERENGQHNRACGLAREAGWYQEAWGSESFNVYPL